MNNFTNSEILALPGGDLVLQGLEDLKHGRETRESLLVSIGAPRLAALGIKSAWLSSEEKSVEHRLFELCESENDKAAHSCYNALIRRLVSFERSAELLQRCRSIPDIIEADCRKQ